jgi:hypothetical protein
MAQKRVRPQDGGITWRAELHAFECFGCGEFIELRKRCENENPECLAEVRELLVIDHTECWLFDDPRMAADARRYRKESRRKALLSSGQFSGVSGQGKAVRR